MPPTCLIRRSVAVTALAAAVAVSCASEQPTSETRPTNLTPLATTTTTPLGPPVEVGQQGLLVESPDVVAGDTVTADAVIEAPTLEVSGVREGAVALAVVAVDADRGRTHWVLSGLAPTTSRIDPDDLPPEVTEYQNESGEFGWLPVSETPARLRISVLALDTTVTPTPENPATAVTAFEAVAIDTASMTFRVIPDS